MLPIPHNIHRQFPLSQLLFPTKNIAKYFVEDYPTLTGGLRQNYIAKFNIGVNKFYTLSKNRRAKFTLAPVNNIAKFNFGAKHVLKYILNSLGNPPPFPFESSPFPF